MLDDTISNLVMGLVYFFIIACAFFIQYKIIFNAKTTARLNKIKKPFVSLFEKIKKAFTKKPKDKKEEE